MNQQRNQAASTESKTTVDDQLKTIFSYLSNDPTDVRRLLESLALALHLIASKLSLDNSTRRELWDQDKRATHRFKNWVHSQKRNFGTKNKHARLRSLRTKKNVKVISLSILLPRP